MGQIVQINLRGSAKASRDDLFLLNPIRVSSVCGVFLFLFFFFFFFFFFRSSVQGQTIFHFYLSWLFNFVFCFF